jgi:hypothetical protein
MPLASVRFILLTPFIGLIPTQAQTTPAWHPLNGEERWANFFDTTVTAPTFWGAALVSASYSQITNAPPEWSQGAYGLGRRMASKLAIYGIQETIHQGGEAILGYDPRYLACGCKGFWTRTGHAIKWSFLTKNKSGRTRFDFPAIAGMYGAGMLSTYWYPPRFNPLTDGVRNGNQQLGISVGLNVFREFEPDVKRLLKKH